MGVDGTSSSDSGGSGSFDVYGMNVKKYADGNMNHGLAATFELYEARVKDDDGSDIQNPDWEMIATFTTDVTREGLFEIRTVTRPGTTEPKSLRPYSYHNLEGEELFGPGNNKYGWRYRIKEITAPQGYQKTDVVYEFGISDIPSYTAPYNYLNYDTVTIVNKPVPTSVEITIPGKKVLVGKELEDQEFTFSLTPEENALDAWGEGYPYPGGFTGSLTAKNDEEGKFSFKLSYTNEDYAKAVEKELIDEDGCARFQYIVREELPQDAVDHFLNGVKYDENQFLVDVKLFIEGGQPMTETHFSVYEGGGAAGD